MRLIPALLIAFLAAAVPAAETERPVLVNATELRWEAAPATLPAGAKLAVLFGDPGLPGPFTIRLSMPAGYKIPPHSHTKDESVTVITGRLYLGMGDKADPAVAEPLKEGGFHHHPARARHFVFTKAATVAQITGEGPFDIQYLDPADDPSTGR